MPKMKLSGEGPGELETPNASSAFGLPSSLSPKSALGSLSASDPGDEPAFTPPAAEKPEPEAEEPVPAEAAEAPAKPATGEPAVEKPAKAEPKPAAKPEKAKTPVAPAVEKPAAAAPADKPAETAPAKFKVGDKEYTEAELKELLAPKKPVPSPIPLPEKKDTPAEAPKAKTPEETAKEAADLKAKDSEWIVATAKHVETPLDDATLDKILSGGAEAVEALNEIRRRDVAQAVLMARKSIIKDIEPVLKGIRDVQQPLIDSHRKSVEEKAWSDFEAANPDLKDYRDVVTTIGQIMVDSNHPALADVKSMEDFGRIVGEEARRYIGRFAKTGAAPAPAAPAEPVAPVVPATVPAVVKPKVKPPVANAPAPQSTAGKKTRVDVASLLPP